LFCAVAEHLTAQRSAIKMLVSRVRAVLATVRAIRDGALPPRPALLREARALSNRLPLLTSQQFRTHFYNVSTLCHNPIAHFIGHRLRTGAMQILKSFSPYLPPTLIPLSGVAPCILSVGIFLFELLLQNNCVFRCDI
jgi:hypothetical protein